MTSVKQWVDTYKSIDEAWRAYRDEKDPVCSRSHFRDLAHGLLPDSGVQKLFFMPDTHRPYHDPEAVATALAALKHYKPDHLIILGDYGDFYCSSRHAKNPNRPRDLQIEIQSCNDGLDELDACGVPNKHFVAGNHEDNLRRYMEERAPELYNMVKVEELFRLKQRGWSYTPYKSHMSLGKLYITHEVGFAGRDAHMRGAAAFGGNLVQGHTHRLAVSYTGTLLGERHVSMMCGWLGNAEMADYTYRASRKDWQHGFGIGVMDGEGNVHLQAIPIVNGVCNVNGTLIRG